MTLECSRIFWNFLESCWDFARLCDASSGLFSCYGTFAKHCRSFSHCPRDSARVHSTGALLCCVALTCEYAFARVFSIDNGFPTTKLEQDEFNRRHEQQLQDLSDRMGITIGKKKSEEPKVGRNDPCHCGTGKKYKKCCGR